MRRRPWRLLALALLLAVGDLAQRLAFVAWAPSLEHEVRVPGPPPPTWTLLLPGEGMDPAEDASSRRDLAFAARSVRRAFPGQHRVLAPEVENLAGLLQELPAEARLVLYATGHGGGLNFGATKRMNLTREGLAALLASVRCRSILVVLDACWSGEFARSFTARPFASPTVLVTSTDDQHMAPYPTSFLSLPSYGRDFFAALAASGDPESAFAATQKGRRWQAALYPETIGVTGTISRAAALEP